MNMYSELVRAIDSVVKDLDETEEFKKRFSKMVENYYEDSCEISDIEHVIESAKKAEDET